ncbi:hypothetical protein WMY93_003409 [Mugilogobius chulae]|uniref:Uncharacterized protein n=1 Tax=Mugilogobius chulae TaxID=88201 RepID=A0AAW0PW42_9GOBI
MDPLPDEKKRRRRGGGCDHDQDITGVCTRHLRGQQSGTEGVQQTRQVLEVDGKSFDLRVTEHPGGLDQDRLIINLSATVDCSQLSAASRKTLKGLNKIHPDVQMNYNSARELYTLSGSYSTVQAALAQLLGQNGPARSTTENKTAKTGTETSNEVRPNPPAPLPRTQVIKDQSRSQREPPLADKHTTNLQRDSTPGGHEWDPRGATAGPTEPEEDFSLMVDADTFQYMQKYCREEYHQILRNHGVAVVDYSHQGLTTLLLQVASGDGLNEQECLKKAKREISRLYEENQAMICRDKLLKSILPNRAGLKKAIDKLTSKFAKLHFSEDEQNLYFIGSREDVSEAKTFLLLHDHSEEDKTDITSTRRFQDSWPGNEAKVPVAGFSESNGVHKDEDNAKQDDSPKIKLAAQFKDPRVAPIGSKTGDFSIRGHQQSNQKKRPGPMIAHDVLSETNKAAYVNAQNTGGDVLFKSAAVAVQNAGLSDTRPKTASNSLDEQMKSGTSLRRTSSFSGVVQKKDQETSPKSDTELGKGRGRSSSFSNGEEQHTAEITVNGLVWLHIEKAYKPRLVIRSVKFFPVPKCLLDNKTIHGLPHQVGLIASRIHQMGN